MPDEGRAFRQVAEGFFLSLRLKMVPIPVKEKRDDYEKVNRFPEQSRRAAAPQLADAGEDAAGCHYQRWRTDCRHRLTAELST